MSHAHHHHHHDHDHDHAHFEEAARKRLDSLTKPPGSLGRLEDLAAQLCRIEATHHPQSRPCHVLVFAGDHGVCEEGVSAFPQAVTGEMLKNMASGGAAVSVLARLHGADLRVIDVGSIGPHDEVPGVTRQIVRKGTANFTMEPAMTLDEMKRAMKVGSDAATQAMHEGMKVLILGEMGIGNTTTATALAAQILGLDAGQIAGPGTGLDCEGVNRKADAVNRALALHKDAIANPAMLLARLGGLEIAAMAGAMLAAGPHHVPILLDGFIVTAAAAVAVQFDAHVKPALIAAHRSAEPGHRLLLEHLGLSPLLELDMRLGEASGALTALPLLDAACTLYNEMATFGDAGVSH